MSFAYPTTLDATSAFTSLAKALRDGTLTSNAAQSAQDAWVVQGFAQSQLLGSPKASFSVAAAFAAPADPVPSDIAAEFEAAAAHLDGNPAAFAAVPVEGKINWQNLLKNAIAILQIVLPLIPV